jgi:hypothetical protein
MENICRLFNKNAQGKELMNALKCTLLSDNLRPYDRAVDITNCIGYVPQTTSPTIPVCLADETLKSQYALYKLMHTLTRAGGRYVLIHAGGLQKKVCEVFCRVHPNVKVIVISDRLDETYAPIVTTTQDASLVRYEALKIAKESEDSICAINDYFDTELALLIGCAFAGTNVLFVNKQYPNRKLISDGKITDKRHSDADIVLYNAQSFLWVNIINPTAWMVMFNCPYYQRKFLATESDLQIGDISLAAEYGADFSAFYKQRQLLHLSGDLYNLPFGSPSSTECALIGHLCTTTVHYSYREYEGRMFALRGVYARFGVYKNKNANELIGYDKCHSCALYNQCLTQTAEFTNVPMHDLVNDIEFLVVTLKREYHGHLLNLPRPGNIMRATQEYRDGANPMVVVDQLIRGL